MVPLRPASSPVSPPISSNPPGTRLLPTGPGLSRPPGPIPAATRLGVSSSSEPGPAPGKRSTTTSASKSHPPGEGGNRPPAVTHTQTAPVLDKYASRQAQFPSGITLLASIVTRVLNVDFLPGNWLAYTSPPHAGSATTFPCAENQLMSLADADELVDTDSSDDSD